MDEYNGPECGTYYGSNHACVNHCQNGGACHLDGSMEATCFCLDGWLGPRCERASQCKPGYCKNAGKCLDTADKPEPICM